MIHDKASLVRQLVPTSYHFDGYNEINCPNSRDKPFFGDNVVNFEDHYHLTTQLVNKDKISLNFSNVCPYGEITFHPYLITLEEFVSKLKVAVSSGRDLVPFEIPVQRRCHSSSYCASCKEATADCRELRKNLSEKVFAAVSFDFNDMKEALAMYFEITNTQTSKGGKSSMKNRNKFFGVNFEFGLSKDPNIASTLMGLAVKNTQSGNWYVFDPVRNTRKNIANIKMGNFPVMLIPTQQYVVGHLYKENGQYYYVQALNPNGTVKLISATDGITRELLPEESLIPGMNFYTEVIAFDANTMMNANSNENVGGNILAAMLMMNWSKGNSAEFSLDNINDESFNGMGSYLPLLLFSKSGNLGSMFTNPDGSTNIAMLMALGSGDGDNNDMMQMMVLSQLLGGETSPFPKISPYRCPPPRYAPMEFNSEDKLRCEKCDLTYPDGTNFCPQCGGKTKPSTKACRSCGTALMVGALFCHNCGAKVPSDFCQSCGRHIDTSTNFCPGCGTPVNGSSEVAKTAAEAVGTTPIVVPAEPVAEASTLEE